MPRIGLYTQGRHGFFPTEDANGHRLLIPRPQFRCWVRLPAFLTPRDGVVDTGSPFTWFPEAIWSHFQPGTHYEELPFPAGYLTPSGHMAGWRFTFRFARLLQPLVLLDTSTEFERHGVVVQFADGNPPSFARSNAPPWIVIGLWGGILEGTRLHIATNPAASHVTGALEW